MALFRKFFYRKPPDGLLEISERVYVFDCCYCMDTFEEEEYEVYIGGIVGKLRNHLPDASFMVFNFQEGENQSQIASVLSQFDMTVMDYPQPYESFPLLSMEMIHHSLRSSESWLSLGQQNVVLMHCERGGWPVLAFMLAALLLYGKQFTGEQRTLDMIYKQGPQELLQLTCPINPLPSQLRYLQYVSRRNMGTQWPPLDRSLTLDCIILRVIPSMDREGGCRPIFRIYGQDPFMAADRTTKVLFSTPRSKFVQHYKQADCELVKIDINCHIQGDVVMECINLDSDHEREQMMFRAMFNTAFIRSNILMLNRDEIDTLWDAKDQFPKDFRAEVLFSEMNSGTPIAAIDLPGLEGKDGIPMEAFPRFFPTGLEGGSVLMESTFVRVQEKPKLNESENKTPSPTSITLVKQSTLSFKPFSDTNSVREEAEAQELKVALQSMPSIKSSPDANSAREKVEPQELKVSCQSTPSIKPSSDANSTQKKVEPQEVQVALQWPAQSKIISQRVPQTSLSSPVSYCNNLQGSPLPMSRYHSAPSALGITALLHDHAVSKGEEVMRPVTLSLPSSAISSPVAGVLKPTPLNNVSAPRTPPPPEPLQSSIEAPKMTEKPSATCHIPPAIPQPISISSPITDPPKPAQLNHVTTPGTPPCPLNQHPQLSSGSIHSPLFPSQLSSLSASSSPVSKSSSSAPPAPPPPPSISEELIFSAPFSTSCYGFNSCQLSYFTVWEELGCCAWTTTTTSSTSSSTSWLFPGPLLMLPSVPQPPPPPKSVAKASSFNAAHIPPVPPPAPLTKVLSKTSSVPSPPLTKGLSKTSSVSSPPLHFGPALGPANAPSVPPPPPPPSSAAKTSFNNAAHIPLVPPPPAPLTKGLSRTSSVSSPSHAGVSNGNVPSVPRPPSGAPFSAKGQGMLRINAKNQPRKANLKPYHWLKLTRALSGSLWAEAQKADEASKAPEFDMSELETLFSAAAPNSDCGSTAGKSNRHTLGHKSDKIQLIELRRAYNCEIMLSKVKIPLPDLMSSVLALDDTALDIDQVDSLIKFCPTKEEMELLKGYNGDKEKLGKCEQFFLEMMKVPRAESKLRVFSFKIQFQSQVSDLRGNLNVINSASEEIRSSAKLKRIMQTILSLGNALNHGTARGSAVGFRLDSLLKLTDTRSRNNKMTLMHYLCKVLAERLPELLDFSKDLVNLEAATKIQLKYLAEEMQAVSKGLEKVMQELTASENDGLVSESFCKNLRVFLAFAESEVRSLASLYSSVGRNADALAFYFGEDPARCPFEQVVSTLLNFVRMFVRAHDENKKQLELEKKKAEKDAQNEKKSTMASPRKLSENLDLFSYRQHHCPPWLTPRYKLTENLTKREKLEFKSREVFYIAARIKNLNAGVHCRDGYSFFVAILSYISCVSGFFTYIAVSVLSLSCLLAIFEDLLDKVQDSRILL
ncbi:FORMIN-J [Salix viminalis]|uniref:Formin-like protein n=2 Tax=Salix viminalis TaxID=40686 RepID=A0A9Q0NQ97_SALVM|nr:FORMIN-J [Salix viminalis]